jgi:16S rRNA (uracil1498-N3)-methyltransferase
MKVLRLEVDEHVVLFDGVSIEGEYVISSIDKHQALLRRIAVRTPKRAQKKFALLWSLLKKDKNEWVLQKGVELGVTDFVPIITERTEKTGFPIERAHKIILEAVEQSGRSDIPKVSEPKVIYETIQKMREDWTMIVLDEGGQPVDTIQGDRPTALLVGPEGGWSERERNMFRMEKYQTISIGEFTLRAETAAIVGPAVIQKILKNKLP